MDKQVKKEVNQYFKQKRYNIIIKEISETPSEISFIAFVNGETVKMSYPFRIINKSLNLIQVWIKGFGISEIVFEYENFDLIFELITCEGVIRSQYV
jgi:hypothetical protein